MSDVKARPRPPTCARKKYLECVVSLKQYKSQFEQDQVAPVQDDMTSLITSHYAGSVNVGTSYSILNHIVTLYHLFVKYAKMKFINMLIDEAVTAI